MPLYEYQCKKCKHVFTELAKFEDKIKCPLCKRATKKLIATTNRAVFVHRNGNFKQRRKLSTVGKSGKKS
jgi:putative FmdB family regulatory protein